MIIYSLAKNRSSSSNQVASQLIKKIEGVSNIDSLRIRIEEACKTMEIFGSDVNVTKINFSFSKQNDTENNWGLH